MSDYYALVDGGGVDGFIVLAYPHGNWGGVSLWKVSSFEDFPLGGNEGESEG